MLGCSCGGRGQLGWVGSGVRLPGSSHHSFGASNVRIMDNQSHMGPSTSSSAELFNSELLWGSRAMEHER